MLDPDSAGKEIRSKLNKLLPDSINVEVDINKCNRRNKKGIAECQIEEILSKLHRYVIQGNENTSDIKESDLYKLGLIGNKERRDKVCKELNLGKCNGKTLYKRLLNNNVSFKQLCEILK